jgi:uncharacterized protein (TIGR03067 family)
MVSRCLAVVVGLACVAVPAARGDDTSGDAKKLEGTWLVKTATLDGKDVADMKDGQIVIAGDKLTIKPKDGKETDFTFKLDATKKPKTMRLAFVEKVPSAAPGQVIYALGGDDLKLVIGPPDKTPTEFTDKGQPLVTLKRKK